MIDEGGGVEEQDQFEDEWLPVDGFEEIAEQFDLVDLDLAQHVTHPMRGRLVRRLRRAHSAAELASWLGVPVTRLYHHLKLLEGAGLISVVATRRVGAATERRYRASAKAYRIPEEVFEQAGPAQLATVLGSLFDLAKLDLVQFVERGGMAKVDPDRPVTIGLMQLQLTPTRRIELVSALETLLQEFGADEADARDDSGRATPFLLFAAGFPPDGEEDADPAA